MVDGLADALTHRPLIALVTLFGAGLVTSLTPCIYPMIPITAGILSGTSAGQPSRARTARLTLAYVTGLALFYAILGLFAGLSGSLFGTVSASPWARFAIGNLLLVDRKSTRLNSSHGYISYAVFCLKKKNHRPKHLIRSGVERRLSALATADPLHTPRQRDSPCRSLQR